MIFFKGKIVLSMRLLAFCRGSAPGRMEIEANGKRARASSSTSLTGGDRLSSLPDCLIHHIMSFMKARQVVQTCVLSTRWKHLWRSVPCLDIDVEEFETTGSNPPREAWGKFEDFTDHLLIPNNISIALLDTFCLHVSGMYKSYRGQHATRWIRHGIKYSTRAPGMQRQGLSSSSWHLRKLYLSNLYLDDNFTEHVSSGCQNLEDLELKGCYCRTFHEISSHSLKNLILKDCEFSKLSAITSPALKSLVIESDGYSRIPSLLVITAPAVAYLLLDVEARVLNDSGLSLEEMPSLGKVSIHLRRNNYDVENVSKEQLKLLCSVSNVMSLVLSRFATMVCLLFLYVLFPFRSYSSFLMCLMWQV